MKSFLAVCLMTMILCGTFSAMAQQPPAPAPALVGPKPAWMEYQTPYAGEETDITNPHRTSEEITAWALQAVTDVLSFGPDNYQGKMDSAKKYFAPTGWKLYSAYLKDAHVLSMVTDNKYSVGAVVTGAPEIVDHASVGGAYHWIVRLPFTISSFSADANGDPVTVSSGKFILFIDVEHVAAGSGTDDMAINHWRVDDVAKR